MRINSIKTGIGKKPGAQLGAAVFKARFDEDALQDST
jgi:hypothetical protein